MAVNIKLGVDYAGFKQGMREAQASVSTLDAALKKNEAQFKATGDAEQYMAQKSEILRQKMQSQKTVVENASKALAEMNKKGIPQTSTEYQKLSQQLLNAEAAMLETQSALDNLSSSQENAATTANQLVQSMNGIGKKISLDQVISGINSITSGLENAAGKAVQLGETIWNAVMDRAKWADDTATMALMYGIDLDTFLRMQKLVQNGLDTSVDAILTAQTKMRKGIGNGTIADELEKIGVSMRTWDKSYDENGTLRVRTLKTETELFWEAGQAIMNLSNAYDKEAIAQNIFGRSWKELVPLFTQYKSLEEYQEALDGVTVSSEEDVNALAELNDKVNQLKGNLEQLSTDILATLAPALTEGAEALNGVLESILEYLRTPEGKAALKQLGDAISGLFGDLANVDPEKVVGGFIDAFTKVTGGIQWLVDNQETAKGILGTIVGGWATLKLMGGAADVLKLVQGIQGLAGGVNLAGINGVGASLGSAFASALATVLPGILIGVLTAPTIEKLLRGETPEEKENREKIEEIAEVGKETGGDITKPTLREALSFANSNGVLPESYVERAAREAEVWTFVGADGGIYSENGDRVGYAMPKGTGLILKSRKPGGTETPAKEISEEVGPVDLDAHFVVSDDVDDEILAQLGIINIPARISISGISGGGPLSLNGITQMMHANGLPWVPNDNYLALLHRGERVLTASENKHYTYNSNTYFGSVNLHNGLEVDALAESIARNNRRKASGFGS